MNDIDRRSFVTSTTGSMLAYALLDVIFAREAFADDVKPILVKWLRDLNEMSIDAKKGTLSQTDWQKSVDQLFGQVELPELLKLIDFQRIEKKGPLADVGARSYRFAFGKIDGVTDRLVFGQQIFGLKKDRSVVPHGHENMVTAFLILKGDFHGRHYDRFEGDKTYSIIKPTIDDTFTVGGHSTISDVKDNVHWFKATSDGSYILNIHVLGVDKANREPTGRVYLDPNGEKLSDGRIRAPRISYEQAHKLYG
ncbi:hypothetical protein K2Y11_20145 [bacterium]|nr:hypothetical protein [bacterium]